MGDSQVKEIKLTREEFLEFRALRAEIDARQNALTAMQQQANTLVAEIKSRDAELAALRESVNATYKVRLGETHELASDGIILPR